jgi:uncharacterized protein YjbI with pentapeptide repeats
MTLGIKSEDVLVAKTPSPEKPGGHPPARAELPHILEEHRDWLATQGEAGAQANLSGSHLEAADLTDADLRNALLNKAVLTKAELLLADLRGSHLVQASLQDANLLGTKLQEADLQGANLGGATGLQSGQLAGANLYRAELPSPAILSQCLKDVAERARTATWLAFSTLLLNALACWRILTISDVQLFRNGPILPFSFARVLPVFPFCLFGPVAICGFYLGLHLYLQYFWEGAAGLPAILPDGRCVDTCLPLVFRWPVRAHFQWLRKKRRPLWALEAALSKLLLYGTVPASMLCFWGRYLTLQDLRGTMLHVLLVVGAFAAAMYFPVAVRKAFQGDLVRPEQNSNPKFARSCRFVPPGIGVLLILISIGTIFGVPHESATPERNATNFRAWAADVLWSAGYSPTAQVSETEVSTKLGRWQDSPEGLALVQGAQLSRLQLRYLQGYGAFFAKARLAQTDLRHADLTGADLREANLREADLRYAVLDGANLWHAVLQQASLQSANFIRADLRQANVSRASLMGALLLDAKLDGANLYGSDLRGAQLQRTNLQQADLREANLEGADLSMASLRDAYLSSAKMAGARLAGAQLAQAFLAQTDLRKADLTGANLQGAVLSGAELAEARLGGADLRGVAGLTARQLCSAADTRQVQLDEALQRETELQCGTNH